MTIPVERRIGGRTPEGRIVRVVDPVNDEFDLQHLNSIIVPNGEFYIRSHGPIPRLDQSSWRLKVNGLVNRPLILSLKELQMMPSTEAVVTLECAGNRRTFQRPIPAGVPWELGAVSTAQFRGVPLATILQAAGLKPEGKHVRLQGADLCSTDSGLAPFSRSIPLDLALQETTILVLTMNGEPLPPEHGGPGRLVLPNYYAMNSVKWLTSITVQEEPDTGHFQVNDYRLWYDGGPGEEIGPLRVTSVIAAPASQSTLPPGMIRIHGAAWTGTGIVERVEVSVDGGQSWQHARLISAPVPGAWRLWEYEWKASPGEYTLFSRATDSEGHTQPDSLPPNRKGYANNFLIPVPVRVLAQ